MSFLEESLLQDGIIRQLQIIDKAVKRLSADLRTKHPNFPWEDIAGMRDKLTHDYLGVDLLTVWDTVNFDIPQRKVQMVNISLSFTAVRRL